MPPGPLICGMNEPSLSGLYVNAWKCIECRSLWTRSSFLKWTKTLSPTRASMSGPGTPSLSPDAARLGSGFFHPRV